MGQSADSDHPGDTASRVAAALSSRVLRAGVLWGKHDGDGKQLAAWQSMVSGFSAACLGPTVTNPFDVIKVRRSPRLQSSGLNLTLFSSLFSPSADVQRV